MCLQVTLEVLLMGCQQELEGKRRHVMEKRKKLYYMRGRMKLLMTLEYPWYPPHLQRSHWSQVGTGEDLCFKAFQNLQDSGSYFIIAWDPLMNPGSIKLVVWNCGFQILNYIFHNSTFSRLCWSEWVLPFCTHILFLLSWALELLLFLKGLCYTKYALESCREL